MRGSSYKVLTGKVLVFSRTGRCHYWAGNVNTEVLHEQYTRLMIYMEIFCSSHHRLHHHHHYAHVEHFYFFFNNINS